MLGKGAFWKRVSICQLCLQQGRLPAARDGYQSSSGMERQKRNRLPDKNGPKMARDGDWMTFFMLKRTPTNKNGSLFALAVHFVHDTS